MAGLFGFDNPADAYRYRCALAGEPSNAACFGDFARRLKSFFHGEHPTRITWYRHQPALDSVQAARTVYTGNYVFRPRALNWFIPFAPLRLRMSGPTLGRLMKAELGDKFISANLPMLHTRTLDDTGEAEFRPGVVTQADTIDLADEFERQFYGDVMLFSVERLTAQGFPQQALSSDAIAATLDAVHADMALKYRTRHAGIVKKLAALSALLDNPAHWWHAPRTRRGARAVPRVPRQHAAQLRHGFAGSCTHRLERTRAALASTPARRPHPVACGPRRLEPGARRPLFPTGMIERLRHRLHRRRHPLRYAHLDALLRTQALPRDDLLAKQQRDLADIVAFAAAHTPYYAETLTPFLDHGRFDLATLPILKKDDVTRRLDDLLARSPNQNHADRSQVKIGHTGGSTGKPLAFWYDDAKHELMRAGMMRSYRLSGWRPGQKILNFWGARQDVVPGGVFGAPARRLHRRRTHPRRVRIHRSAARRMGTFHPALPARAAAGLCIRSGRGRARGDRQQDADAENAHSACTPPPKCSTTASAS